MIDVAADLKERFDFAAIWFLERSDVMRPICRTRTPRRSIY
jgi:hypothetical protein